MEALIKRIIVDETICNGKPTIRGKRITVQSILEYLGAGDSVDEILKEFPTLEKDDIQACLLFAAEITGNNFSIKSIA